jgi:hypothetical protein
MISLMDSPSYQDGDLVIDGDVVRGTFSPCAGKVRLNPFRYFYYAANPAVRLIVMGWLMFLLPMLAAFVLQWWIAGIVLALPTVAITLLMAWIARRTSEIFYSAGLTPGLVVSQHPLEFISLANMDCVMGEPAYAVKRVGIRNLPCFSSEPGTTFPCVSGFLAGPDYHRWADFDPQPLSLGTGDRRLLQARTEKLGAETFEHLKRVYREGRYPQREGEIIFLDGPQSKSKPPPLPKG